MSIDASEARALPGVVAGVRAAAEPLRPAAPEPVLSSRHQRHARGGVVGGQQVVAVLEACELARYAPPQAIPSADACRNAVKNVEDTIAALTARGKEQPR